MAHKERIMVQPLKMLWLYHNKAVPQKLILNLNKIVEKKWARIIFMRD